MNDLLSAGWHTEAPFSMSLALEQGLNGFATCEGERNMISSGRGRLMFSERT